MADETVINGLVVRSVLETLRYLHDEEEKSRPFWQRFFGDDVAIALEHIAHRPDVCDEIADALNMVVEMTADMKQGLDEYKDRRG